MTSLQFNLDIQKVYTDVAKAQIFRPRSVGIGDSYCYFAVHQAREKQVAGLS